MSAPNYSAADFLSALQNLMPRGLAWPTAPDAVMAQVMACLSPTFARHTAQNNNLLIDAFPATTVQLLPEWEAALGLPDLCAGPSPTLQARQAQVLVRFAGSGGQSVPYYVNYAATFGFPVTVTEYTPFRVGQQTMGDPLGTQDWAFTWQVNSPITAPTLFRAGHSVADEALVTWGTNILRCEFARVQPAHTIMNMAYPPTRSLFWGIGGHYNAGGTSFTAPFSSQKAMMTDLGMVGMRQDAYNTGDIDNLVDVVIPGMGVNVNVLPCIVAYPWSDPAIGVGSPTEATAYAYAFGICAYAATRLAGIALVEFGNEYDIDGQNGPIALDGVDVSDYDPTWWPVFRGALRGSLDGWRSVDTHRITKCMANATSGYLHFGWTYGMLNGIQPDGTIGHPQVTPDLLQWHYYQDGGDFQEVHGLTGTYNVLAEIQARYGAMPVIFTELGSSANDQDAASQEAYITFTVAEIVAVRGRYNILGAYWYEMYDYPFDPFGVYSDAVTPKPWYSTLKAAIAANPVS
jgi:uncharacterized protein YmfQ (DUF2313 family)